MFMVILPSLSLGARTTVGVAHAIQEAMVVGVTGPFEVSAVDSIIIRRDGVMAVAPPATAMGRVMAAIRDLADGFDSPFVFRSPFLTEVVRGFRPGGKPE